MMTPVYLGRHLNPKTTQEPTHVVSHMHPRQGIQCALQIQARIWLPDAFLSHCEMDI
jgi:hypothetical protein